METVLWVLQIALGVIFLMAGVMKLLTPKEQLVTKMEWATSVAPGKIKLIGLLELLGAIGVVFPLWLDIVPVLTPLAAIGLALTMLGAFSLHMKRKESAMMLVNVVLFAMAVVIAYFRFMA